jgi:hypothetical protein
VPHRDDGREQRAFADPRPSGIAGTIDRGLTLFALGFRDGTGPAVDDQRRAD